MADFSFNVPEADNTPIPLFEEVEAEVSSSFFEDFSLPTYSEGNQFRLATLAQIANMQLDGQADPLEKYLSRAEVEDGEYDLRTEVDAKELAVAEQDHQDVLLGMIASGERGEFYDYLLNTTVLSTDMLKKTNLERQTAAFLTSTTLADDVGGGYFINSEGEVDDERLSMNEMWAAENLIWTDAIQKLAKRIEDDSILVNTSDVLGLLFKPLGDDLAWAETIGTGSGEFFTDDIKAAQASIAQATGRERLALIKAYTESFLAMGNPIRALSMVDTLQGTLDWRGELGHNFIEAAETFDAGIISGTIFKGTKALASINRASSVAKGAGARKAATDLEVKMAEKATLDKNVSEEIADEAMEGPLHTGLKKALGDDYIDTAGAVNVELEKRVRDLTSVLEEGMLPARLTQEEAASAIAATKVELAARAGNLATDMVDTRFVKEGRTHKVEMYIGSGPNRTDVFVSEEAAVGAAESLHMKPGSFSVTDNGDGFFITLSKEVDESGFIKPMEDTDLLGHSVPILDTLTKVGQGAASQLTREAHGAAVLGQNTASIFQKLLREASDKIAKLPSKGRTEFLSFAQKLHEEEKWMSIPEMRIHYQNNFNRAPTSKDIDTYSNYILANDADYWVRNAKIRKELVTNGYEHAAINGEDVGFAKSVDSIQGDIRTISLFDSVEGKFYKTGSVTSEKVKELMKSDRFSLMEIPSGFAHVEGRANYVVAPTRHVVYKNLPTKVLNYQAGGHRYYNGEHYVKQQRVFTGAGGQEFSGRAKTLYNFESLAASNTFVNKANKALDAFNIAKESGTSKDIRNATEIIQKEMPLWGGYGRMEEMVEDGSLLSSRLEVVRSGKTLTTEGTISTEGASGLSDEVLQVMEQNRFWFQEKRGEHLHTIADVANPRSSTKAPILDPLGALDRSLVSATRMFGFDDYKSRQVDQWIATYGSKLETQEGSSLTRFMSAPFSEQANMSGVEKLQANAWRDAVKRQIGTLTHDERVVNDSMEALIDHMDVSGKQKWAQKFRNAQSSNPVTAIKGLVFDHFMALDPSQLFVQLSMMPGVIAVGGKNGVKAASSYSLLRLAAINDSPEVLARLASTSKVLGGMDSATFKTLWKDMKSSGVLNIMDTQADIATFGKASTFRNNTLAKADYFLEKSRHFSRFFFNEAERGNKGISYSIAWLENFEKTGKGIQNASEAASIAGRAEALAGNMTTASRANWQRGILSVPTQFQAHPIRVMELLLTNNAGFSKKDKIRFLGGLTAAYGAGSLPGVTEMAEGLETWYTNTYGEQPNELTASTFKDGMLGAMMTGLDAVPKLDISRLQTFANSDNNILYQAIMGEKTSLEVMLGPAGSVSNKYLDDAQGALWLKGLFNGSVTFSDVPFMAADVAASLSDNIAGINRMTAAYLLHSTGEMRDSKGRLVVRIDDPSIGQVFGTALGFKPIEVDETYAALTNKKVIEDTQDFFAERITDSMRELRDLAVDVDTDPQDIFEAKRRLNIWWSMAKGASPDIQYGAWHQTIFKKALSRVGKDEVLAHNLAEYFRKLNVNIVETK